MSTFESSYKSLLQGVSQQIPRERLPGQVTSQLNMLSDPVTNLRRRPGAQYMYSRGWGEVAANRMCCWFTDVAGERLHVLLNTATGEVLLLDTALTEVGFLDAGEYLQTTDISRIRAATVGNEFFIANLDVVPTVVTGAGYNARGGFAYIVAGAFGKAYDLTVKVEGGSTYSASYTTPGGTGAGDAALTTPEYIATQLVTQLTTAGLSSVWSVGPYIYCEGETLLEPSVVVTTTVSSNYIVASKNRLVPNAGSLPARLPEQAGGFVCRVGTAELAQYFTYDSADLAWVEVGEVGSPTGLQNVPISIVWGGAAWELNDAQFEGRLAGDSETNRVPEFVTQGITGMATYQGRLVLMSGPMVCLSASGKPRRFFRSTVTSVVDSDTIEIGSGMNSSAAYVHAIPFQKDLVLFSSGYQAVIPSNNVALTPRNATVVPTSAHEVDATSPPLHLGRTLMYAAPRSADFFGVREMVPSPYTDSQYVSLDATQHLPKYMGGRCRFSVSSNVANMALFAPSGDTKSLIVHEYMWDGDQKVQQAWHMWTFPYDVAMAYFAYDKINLVFAQNGILVLASIDPREGVLTPEADRRPFLDLWSGQTVIAHSVEIPAWLLQLDPSVHPDVTLTALSGNLAGDLVGAVVSGDTLVTVRSFPSGTVGLGLRFRSSFSPTPPMVRDFNEVVVSTNKTTLLRYILGTKNSSEFKVSVSDGSATAEDIFDVGTLLWSSHELELGRSAYSTDAGSIIPCRTASSTTNVDVYTEGTGELNVVSLEYVLKTNQKIKRR